MVIYSHSRLSTFEQCRLKFKFRYIDNLEPDIKQTIEGFLGNRVHDTLEMIYKEVKNGKQLELDEVIHFYIERWNKEYSDEIKIVNESCDAEHYFNLGIKFLIDYFMGNSPFKDNTISTEQKIVISLDDLGKYQVQGFIDRLVHDKETNIFEIHDYKTSSFLKSQDDLDNDRQLALYSIGVKKMFQEVKDVHLIWHFLAFNKKMVSSRSDQQLEELKIDIMRLIDEIESTKEFNPNTSALCRWCEFQSYCPEIKKQNNYNN